MQHDHVNSDILNPWVKGVVCGLNICYQIAAFVIPFHLICNMSMFCKSCMLTHKQGLGGGGGGGVGSVGKIFATMLLHVMITFS